MNTPQYNQAVVIGASAGALEALAVILPALPGDFPLPVFVVVHLPPDKESIMAQLLAEKCRLPVHEAEDKMPIEAGHVYIAPPDYHLLVEVEGYLSLSTEEAVMYSRPSIDVLFESAADAYGAGLIGIVLTGGNADGAHGLRLIVDAGGTPLIQDPDEAQTSAMPKAALKACPMAYSLPLTAIADHLTTLVKK